MTVDTQANDPALAPAARLDRFGRSERCVVYAGMRLALYAFLLKVDLDEGKRRLSKEVEARQQVEGYLIETRNLLTNSLREIEQLRRSWPGRKAIIRQPCPASRHCALSLDFRSSLLGRGWLPWINNTSDRYLTLVLVVRIPTLSTVKRFTLN